MITYVDDSYEKIKKNIESGNSAFKSAAVDGFCFFYDLHTKKYNYGKTNELVEDGEERTFRTILLEENRINKNDLVTLDNAFDAVCSGEGSNSKAWYIYLKNKNGIYQFYRICISKLVNVVLFNFYNITEACIKDMYGRKDYEFDRKTGLYHIQYFLKYLQEEINEYGIGTLVYFDILQYKAFKEIYGYEEARKLLGFIGKSLNRYIGADGFACHIHSDYFAIYTRKNKEELIEALEYLMDDLGTYNYQFELQCNFGIATLAPGSKTTASELLEHAIAAHTIIKGNYSIKFSYYTKEMEDSLLAEQQLVGIMNSALEENQFKVYFQPQYNHSTGLLIGAEALVRWQHPERGLISPGLFIPVFEKNGFITNLDLYVFEQTCRFIRQCMDDGIQVVPISTNVSRNDIVQPDFVYRMELIRKKHRVPVRYLRIEITESAVVGNAKAINEFIDKLHEFKYLVEMDDFGSGYSSLNVLKDIDLDIIKLDMKFLYEETKNNRGGTIISAVVRMANWLSLPIIAEGVEELKQADYLTSIGCDYIQGYLYSKPLPEDVFLEKLKVDCIEKVPTKNLKLIDTLNPVDFWNPASMETLIFSNYVGGAAIVDYHDGVAEILRVNKKFMIELNLNASESDIISSNLLDNMDERNKEAFKRTLDNAIGIDDEVEVDTWVDMKISCCQDENICIRNSIRLIGKSKESYLFYIMVKNVTAEKNQIEEFQTFEKRFKYTAEQANVYFWEYTVATKEMRPCFRCMRDLGLPAVVPNYPEPSIEAGIFPPDYADLMRDWIRRIDRGEVSELEAVVPLTPSRIPFNVKYNVEFDEDHNPVRAYASATYIHQVD